MRVTPARPALNVEGEAKLVRNHAHFIDNTLSSCAVTLVVSPFAVLALVKKALLSILFIGRLSERRYLLFKRDLRR